MVCQVRLMDGSRSGTGDGSPSLKNHKNIGFLVWIPKGIVLLGIISSNGIVLLGIIKYWVETVETRVGPRVGYHIHWSDPTKAYTHTLPINILLPYIPSPNANATQHQHNPTLTASHIYHYQYAI